MSETPAPVPTPDLPARTQVLVVGAGLAGLRCAVSLEASGHEVTLVEAANAVGGRIRTEEIDGHLVDRGFQLLNPAYPAVRRWVDVAALRLGTFVAGVAAVDSDEDGSRERLVRLGHPWHAPQLIPATLAAVRRDPVGTAGLVRWAAPLLSAPGLRPRDDLDERLGAHTDRSLRQSFDDAGVAGLPRRVLEGFLSGVILDDDGDTSAHLVQLLVSSFVAGTPGLPARGMQALPDQIAARLRRPPHLGVRAVEITRDDALRVETDRGPIRAEVVVVAAGPEASAALLGRDAPPMRGVVTDWWTTPTPPAPASRRRLLHVDARPHPGIAGRGRTVANVAVVSAAAPSYAPRDQHLVAASVVTGVGRDASALPDPGLVRGEAAHLLGADPSDWVHLTRHDVRAALPAQAPPLDSRREVDLGDGLFHCGDHRDTASIQGALVSGERAATAVRRRLT